MRKFLVLQLFLFILGLGILFLSKIECEIPQKLLDKINHRFQINIQKLYLRSHAIIFQELNSKDFSCKQLEIRWKSFFSNFQFHIKDGCYIVKNEKFYAINGYIYKRMGKVCGYLHLKNDVIKNIQVACPEFIKISEFLKKFNNVSEFKIPDIDTLSLKVIPNNKRWITIYGEGNVIKMPTMNAEKFHFLWRFGVKNDLKAWIQKISYNQYNFSKCFLEIKGFKGSFEQLKQVCFAGDINTHSFPKTFLFFKSNSWIANERTMGSLVIDAADLKLDGNIEISLKKQGFNISACKGQIFPNFFINEIKKYPIPYTIILGKPLFFSANGSLNEFFTLLNTRSILIDGEDFSAIQSYCHYQARQKFSWHLEAYAKNKRLDCFVENVFSKGKGILSVNGCIPPFLTYPLKNFLPSWWQLFWKDFYFYRDFPQTNFVLHWHKQPNKIVAYGAISANDFRYKDLNISNLELKFGHCPGYCLLDIQKLETKEGVGQCMIHWPYNCQNNSEEFWKFKGQGDFKLSIWDALINSFSKQKNGDTFTKCFQEDPQIQAKFKGILYGETNLKENLNVIVNIPNTILFHFPVQNMNFNYYWTPQEFSMKSVQGILLGTSPFKGNIACKQNHFNFIMEASDLKTEYLLKHPLLVKWTSDIPEENLSMYTGKLDLKLEGSGNYEKNLQLSGKGWLNFDNKQLSKIHLLGPLQNLFSKKFKWKPTIEFEHLVSNFTFTEQLISSQDTVLSGPSTRANLKGDMDLNTGILNAKIYFSFLDYQQLKLPVMKQLFQLFQPISKGFAASIHGTFKNPQWLFTFNPFRFVFSSKK